MRMVMNNLDPDVAERPEELIVYGGIGKAERDWVNFHDGGGVGIGYSQHAGMAILADGSPEASLRIARTLWNDPASGVMRHADAGYDIAIECARQHGLSLPML